MTRQAKDAGILFADVAGSMRLYEAFGNRGALSVIEMCLGLIANVVSQNNGQVVKTIGDEIMATFSDPTDTWCAAIEMQRKVDALAPLRGPQGLISHGLRVGFNFGPTIESNGDMFGTTVNVAARMVQLAKRGQIITTGEAEALVPTQRRRMATRNLDRIAVKGRPDGVPVVEIMWKLTEGVSTTVIDLPSTPVQQERSTQLKLSLGERDWTFDTSCVSVSLGREAANDVVLASSSASRNHATIERRRDRWVLIDHSSNGTFISLAGDDIHLRREELILGREGRIGFGHPVGADLSACASFAIVLS